MSEIMDEQEASVEEPLAPEKLTEIAPPSAVDVDEEMLPQSDPILPSEQEPFTLKKLRGVDPELVVDEEWLESRVIQPLVVPSDSAESLPPIVPTLPVSSSRWEKWWPLFLALVLLLGAYFRWTGINWDEFSHLHPDERFLTIVASKLKTTDPLTYLKTSESPLNPYNVGEGFYVYGNLPMTVVRFSAEFVQGICQSFEKGCTFDGKPINYVGYDGVHFVGRFLSALLDLISIYFIFQIGKRLYNWQIGLMAAILTSASVMSIQQSHFFTADNWAGTFCIIAIYCAIRASEKNRLHWHGVFGLFVGLALASRINVLPLFAMSAVAGAIWISRRISSWQELSRPRGIDSVLQAVVGVAIAALMMIITFRLAMPYAFMDSAMVKATQPDSGAISQFIGSIVGFNPKWLENMSEIQRLQKPDAVFPPALQWVDRKAIIFPLTNMMFYGMGITAFIAAWIGVVWTFFRITRTKPEWRNHVILWLWSIGYFLFMGTRWVKSVRYFLPIYPTLFVFGAWVLWQIWRWSDKDQLKRIVATAAIGIVIVPTLLWANAFMEVYTGRFTRLAASDWFYDNIKSGATLLYRNSAGEEKEFQLPLKNHIFQTATGPLFMNFDMPEDGTIEGIRLNYLTDEKTNIDPTRLQLDLRQRETGQSLVTIEGEINVSERRSPATLNVEPVTVSAETPLVAQLVMTSGGILVAGTTIIANEHWDDSLPARTDTHDPYGSYYQGLYDEIDQFDGQLPMTWPDNDRKKESFVRWLDNTDVIAISSQRAVWSTPRLPMTYPLTMVYYENLFQEKLGFKLAGQFHANIHIGPLYISDTGGEIGWGKLPDIGWPMPNDFTSAEEAFSVYDHPPVWIFVKDESYDATSVKAILDEVDLTKTMFMNPGQATNAPTGLLMDAKQVTQHEQGGTFRNLFDVDGILNRSPLLAALVWWLVIIAIGWLTLPILYTVLPGLPMRGYPISRVLGVLLISYFGWITSSVGLLENTRSTYLIGTLLVGIVSAILFFLKREEITTFIRQQYRYIIFTELLAALLFLVGIIVRWGNPDVWHVIWGGEKPMDLTYFTAVMKSATFPPYDPWYAGGTLNYYYYGFVYGGSLTKLLGIVPTLAYNLLIPTLLSFTGMGAFTLAYELFEQRTSKVAVEESPKNRMIDLNQWGLVAGITATLLCVLLGNLGEMGVIYKASMAAGDPSWKDRLPIAGEMMQALTGASSIIGGKEPPIYPGDWFWDASRALNYAEGEAGPITEFPYFTFLYGDLHAHMFGMPLMFLALAWLLSFGLQRIETRFSAETVVLWFVGALSIGVLYPTNSWDFPTYLVLAMLGLFFFHLRKQGTLNLRLIGDLLGQIGILFVIAYALFLPFHQSFAAGFSEVALWTGTKTHLSNYLVVWGLFVFLILVHLAREFRAWASQLSADELKGVEPYLFHLLGVMGVVLLGTAVAVIKGYEIAPLTVIIILVSTLLALSNRLSPSRRLILALIACGMGLTLVVDIIVIEGTIGRMNTVFKFYLQVWLILSVVGGFALASALQYSLPKWGLGRKTVWYSLAGILFFIAFLYFPMATNAKWETRMSENAPHTLDGMAFMKTAVYDDRNGQISLAADYEAIQWMQRNIDGSPVIAEAYSDNYYRSIGNRIAMYTGLPSIIGWSGHQSQQRNAVDAKIGDRTNDVALLYNTIDIEQTLTILEKYGVKYIYVGQLETSYYSPQGIAKFAEMANDNLLKAVYTAADVTIYEVIEQTVARR